MPASDSASLPQSAVYVLIAIGPKELHGYAIMSEIARITDGSVRVGPGLSIRRSSGCWPPASSRNWGASGPGARRPPAALLPGHTGWPRGRFGGGPTPQGTRDGRRCLGGRPDMTRSERIYRKLLLAYPRSFRARYEDEMVRLFLDQLRDADAAERPGEHAALWARSVADIASSAPSEHLRKESTVAKRVDPGSVALVVSPERSGPRRLGYAIASVPFVVILFATTFAPGFFEPAFANPPEVLGLPAGIVVLFLAATWASIAFLAIRETRSGIGSRSPCSPSPSHRRSWSSWCRRRSSR